MPYCRNCGAEISDEATYCAKCGKGVVSRAVLSSWGERIIAWIIDIVIISAFLVPVKILALIPWLRFLIIPTFPKWIPFVDFGFDNFICLLYWAFLEGITGQSIGKMVMRIKVVKSNGEASNFVVAAVESLGKAFLLPIDCIIGWVFYPNKKQRLFSYLSGTVIVRSSR